MNIIKRKSDNVVIYANVELTDQGVYGGTFVDRTSTPDKVESIIVDSLPEFFVGGKFTYINGVWACIDQEYLATKQDEKLLEQKNQISAERYSMEISGVQYGEYTLLTDRESVQILDSTTEKIRRGVVESIRWKCADFKWITLTKDNVDEIELLILAHVQSTFAWEEQQIEALTTT